MTPFKERMNLYRAYRELNPGKNYWDWKQSLEVPAMLGGGETRQKPKPISLAIAEAKEVEERVLHGELGYESYPFERELHSSNKRAETPFADAANIVNRNAHSLPDGMLKLTNLLREEKEELLEQDIYNYKLMANSLATAAELGSGVWMLGKGAKALNLLPQRFSGLYNSDAAQIAANTIGTVADTYQLLTADTSKEILENSIELPADVAGVIGGTNIVRNTPWFGRYGNVFDNVLDAFGYGAATYDVLIKPGALLIQYLSNDESVPAMQNGGETEMKQYKKAREENPDLKYYDFMERLALFKAKEWNEDPDVVLTYMLNDNSYNYRQMYEDDPNYDIKEGHFTDKYKTVYHPTFSNESMYSGKQSEYNPRGTIGGRWSQHEVIPTYNPSYSQVRNNDFDYEKTRSYLEGTGERIDDYYEDIYDRVKHYGSMSNYARLSTYYPFVSKDYRWTGHSSLSISGLIPNHYGDAQVGTISVDKGGRHNGYNLVTNNCSDATRCALEYAFDKKINPFLFTTPGDVQDFVLDELEGKKDIDGNRLFDLKNGDYAQRGEHLVNTYKKNHKGSSTVYIPINDKEREKLIEFIYAGNKTHQFTNGGVVPTMQNGGITYPGGYTENYWSLAARKAKHKDLDPTSRFSPEALFIDNAATGEEDLYWRAYLGLDNWVPAMNENAKTEWDDEKEAERIAEGKLPSEFFGTTLKMDLNLQAVADTLHLGEIYRNYDEYAKNNPDVPTKRSIKKAYDYAKKVMDHPGEWQLMDANQYTLFPNKSMEDNEYDPLGMLGEYGMKWVPEDEALYVHDTYDFPWYAKLAGNIKDRPREMKIRGKINFNPEKGAKLFRNK